MVIKKKPAHYVAIYNICVHYLRHIRSQESELQDRVNLTLNTVQLPGRSNITVS